MSQVIVFGNEELCECFNNDLFKKHPLKYNEKVISNFQMKFGKFKGTKMKDLQLWYVKSLLERECFKDDNYPSNKNIRKYLKQRFRDESVKV